jgi:hypothetical protein
VLPENYHAVHGARFIVKITKGRSLRGADQVSFEAWLTDDGWVVDVRPQMENPVEPKEKQSTYGTNWKKDSRISKKIEDWERPF